MYQTNWSHKSRKLERVFAKYTRDQLYNGSLLVAKDGEPIVREAAGFADRKRQFRLTDQTMFNIASVGKTMTAAAILLAVQHGWLELDQPMDRWFPDLPYRNATVRQLLAHTSGIPNYIALVRKGKLGMEWGIQEQIESQALLHQVCEVQPTFDYLPGDNNEYSNTGYVLLSMLIERVSGRCFYDFVEEEMFRPFGFKRLTECHLPIELHCFPDYAIGYYRKDEQVILPHLLPNKSFVFALDNIQGDGNFHSSMDELLRWDRLLRSGQLLSASLLEEAYRPMRLNDGTYGRMGSACRSRSQTGYQGGAFRILAGIPCGIHPIFRG